MVEKGKEYACSLDNYLDRKNKKPEDISDPKRLKRIEIANQVIEKLESDFENRKASIFHEMVDGDYVTGVLAFGPTLLNTLPERIEVVSEKTKQAGEVYKSILLDIQDYGMGKTDVIPEIEANEKCSHEKSQKQLSHENKLDSEIAVVRKILLEKYSDRDPENISYGAVLFGIDTLGMSEQERNRIRDMMKIVMQKDANTMLSSKEEHYDPPYHQ